MNGGARGHRGTGAREGPASAVFEAHAWAGLDACVHCGFCLPACPTYEVTADEADSPRGRIVLLRALARGELPPDDPDLGRHLDRCLGCRGCESVCPSGVIYGPALEAARARLARGRGLPAVVRAALWVLARPARQRPLWLASRLLRGSGAARAFARHAGAGASRFRTLLGMLAVTAPGPKARHRGTGTRGHDNGEAGHGGTGARGHGTAAGTAVLLRGCVMDGLFGHVHAATVTALEANDVRVVDAPHQVCCGALAAHAGAEALARDLARRNVAAFEANAGVAIVVNSAGCGSMLRAYGEWLADEPAWAARARAVAARVRDVSEVLAERGPRPGTRPVPLRVAYDAPCHLLHAQRIAEPPRRVLAAVPGLEVIPLEGAERCCGSAGLFALVEPAMARDVLALKLDAIARAAPDVVATGNPGCQMHIGAGLLARGLAAEVRHPVELLAWSYA